MVRVAALSLRRDRRGNAHLPHCCLSSTPSASSYLLEQPDNFAQFLQLLVICSLPSCLSHGPHPIIIV